MQGLDVRREGMRDGAGVNCAVVPYICGVFLRTLARLSQKFPHRAAAWYSEEMRRHEAQRVLALPPGAVFRVPTNVSCRTIQRYLKSQGVGSHRFVTTHSFGIL